MKKIILNDEEKDIIESYERGEWVPVKNAKKEIKKLQQYAKKYTAKRQEDKHSHVFKRLGSSTGYRGARGHPLPDFGIQYHS
jgi:hypothetical protein